MGLLQRPNGLDDMREVVLDMMKDPVLGKKFNATLEKVSAEQVDGRFKSNSSDAFVRLVADPSALADRDGLEDLLKGLNQSALMQDMAELGSAAMEKLQIARLGPGSPVEIHGIQARPELNGQVGVLVEPMWQEEESFPDRRVVCLQDGERVALKPECLRFPVHKLGDAVTLEAEFQGEEEGLEGRAAVVSELTQEEVDLGMSGYGGRVVVDVVPLVPGGPVLHRLLMWPEQLKPRPYMLGDSVELRGLKSDASLNGAAGMVVRATEQEEAAAAADPGVRRVVVSLDGGGGRLAVRRENLLLVSASPGF